MILTHPANHAPRVIHNDLVTLETDFPGRGDQAVAHAAQLGGKTLGGGCEAAEN